ASVFARNFSPSTVILSLPSPMPKIKSEKNKSITLIVCSLKAVIFACDRIRLSHQNQLMT
ncbi:hypothetical protein DRN79_04930, partial [Methanosarcinales archaeon]